MSLAATANPAAANPATRPPRTSPPAAALLWLVKGYRSLPRMRPPSCRYDPTCSQYALSAITTHGALKGTWLSLRRIGRCHPWGGTGFDPVPPRKQPSATSPAAASPTAPASNSLPLPAEMRSDVIAV